MDRFDFQTGWYNFTLAVSCLMSVNTLVKLNLSYIHRMSTGRSRIGAGAGAGYIAFGSWLFFNFVVLTSIRFHRQFYNLGRPRADLAKLCAMILASMLFNNVIYYIVS